MEFFYGIIFTLVVGFVGWKLYQARERRKARKAYVPPGNGGRPVKDYPSDTDK